MLGELEERKYPSFPFVTNLRIIIRYFLTAPFECVFNAVGAILLVTTTTTVPVAASTTTITATASETAAAFYPTEVGQSRRLPSGLLTSACTQTGSHLVLNLYPDR